MVEKIIEGIILNKFPFEDEYIIQILSKEGNLLSIKAKGIDKITSKNRSSLNNLNKCEIEYFTSGFTNTGRLKTSTIKKEFDIKDEWTLNFYNLIKNLILNLSKYSKMTYDSVDLILRKIENNTYSFQDLLSLFIIILRDENYFMKIDKCIKCNSIKNIMGFSLYEGGLICEKHKDLAKYKLDSNFLRKIIEINKIQNPFNCNELHFNPSEEEKLKSMYKLFFENQLGINLFLLSKI